MYHLECPVDLKSVFKITENFGRICCYLEREESTLSMEWLESPMIKGSNTYLLHRNLTGTNSFISLKSINSIFFLAVSSYHLQICTFSHYLL